MLGRHRDDDPRTGWISGLSEAEGERRPTAGGLRIGKRLRERSPSDPYDARLEWERDGQYYHYLVRWMHALARAADVLDDDGPYVWAVELAEAAHEAFVYTPDTGGPKRMRWKMSIDLRRTLVPSEGAHDPLDGLVTTHALLAALPEHLLPRPALEGQVDELERMCRGRRWVSEDPLGAGGLLMVACWAAQLAGRAGGSDLAGLAAGLWADSAVSLSMLARSHPWEAPPDRRLAFRELGLAIGLGAAERTRHAPEQVRRFVPLAEHIVATWMVGEAREAASWTAHRDINAVMLATALLRTEYLRV